MKTKEWNTPSLLAAIGIALVASRMIMYLVYLFWCARTGTGGGFMQAFHRYDAGWYRSIIESGYFSLDQVHPNGEANWAFFPLMPICFSLLNKLLPFWSIHTLAFWVNTGLLGAAIFVGSKYILITRPETGKKTVLFWIIIMCFGPYSFYFSSLYTESIYLLCLCLCFYFLERENYLKLGLCGILLSASRNMGVFFVFVILVHSLCRFFNSTKEKIGFHSIFAYIKSTLGNYRLIAGVCMCPLGLFSYMLYLHFLVGDSLAFTHVQRAWGRNIGSPIKVLGQTIGAALTGQINESFYFMLVVIIGLCLLGYLLVNKYYTEFVMGCLSFFIPLSTGINSIPRYLLGSCVFYLALADGISDSRKGGGGICLLAGLGIFEMWLTYGWFSGWGILT